MLSLITLFFPSLANHSVGCEQIGAEVTNKTPHSEEYFAQSNSAGSSKDASHMASESEHFFS